MEEKKTIRFAIRRAGGAAGGMGRSLLAFGHPLDFPNPNQFHFYFKQGNPYKKKVEMHFERSGRCPIRVCLASRPLVPGRNLLGSKRDFFQVLQMNRKATGGRSVEEPKARSNSACPTVLRDGDYICSYGQQATFSLIEWSLMNVNQTEVGLISSFSAWLHPCFVGRGGSPL